MIDTSAATVIGGPKTNNATSAGGNNTQPPQNRLTHLASLPPSNGSKENNTNETSAVASLTGSGQPSAASAVHATAPLVQQEMNDITVRVINDNASSRKNSNWRNNEATIEVAIASPEDENLPPENNSNQTNQNNQPQLTTTALVNETKDDDVPQQVKISNL